MKRIRASVATSLLLIVLSPAISLAATACDFKAEKYWNFKGCVTVHVSAPCTCSDISISSSGRISARTQGGTSCTFTWVKTPWDCPKKNLHLEEEALLYLDELENTRSTAEYFEAVQ